MLRRLVVAWGCVWCVACGASASTPEGTTTIEPESSLEGESNQQSTPPPSQPPPPPPERAVCARARSCCIYFLDALAQGYGLSEQASHEQCDHFQARDPEGCQEAIDRIREMLTSLHAQSIPEVCE